MIRKLIHKIKALLLLADQSQENHRRSQALWHTLQRDILNNRLAIGRMLENVNKTRAEQILLNIHEAEFQIFSQWGDDGLINFLINYLDIDQKIFVEFGVENYTESNTRFLLINNNWRGLVIDGSEANVAYIQQDDISWRHHLVAVAAFVTAENINALLQQNGVTGEIGLLHIDIDGNDYWVWEKITVVNPVIVIVEYNSVFGIDQPLVIPYNPSFVRQEFHYSNLYMGASLLALCNLAQEKGYEFVASNSHGNNAYFVRKDKIKALPVLSARAGYIESGFAESRDEQGRLSYLRGPARAAVLRGLPVYNTHTRKIQYL